MAEEAGTYYSTVARMTISAVAPASKIFHFRFSRSTSLSFT